ncbi:MAG TPA: carbohydrate ABC transporter permease [Paenibacillus sp.]|nr:carbohydrate ABC transporter permease [Paenibacillus sp.]
MVRSKKLTERAFDALVIALGGATGLLCLAPIWHTLAVSFSNKAAAAAGYVYFWPVQFSWFSYEKLLEDDQFLRSFWISIERVAIGGALNFLLTVLLAYPLSKTARTVPGRNVVMWILVFTMLFNAGLIPWYMTIKELNLLDTIWALTLPGAVPVFNVILLMNFFRGIPKELDEAATVDGAGPWSALVRIFLPVSLPALATITLFSVVGHWNSFFDGLILMNRPEHYPLQTYIQQLVVIFTTSSILNPEDAERLAQISNKTLNAAKLFVAMLPVLLVYPLLQRYFIHGIVLGSVKE